MYTKITSIQTMDVNVFPKGSQLHSLLHITYTYYNEQIIAKAQ
jgi:hypothetical protein